ncbi:pirin family protein [Persicimonas caeni]|uniref:Pirin family protein n=1 Tax=Persicimonas caeni TaxID=2292766 RepID=A0A4Y6Q0H3_PERCE|nr:pirin family protein [Persicimonas caeni]QDG54081.1 pirin family protein [Persicimonas caeni]QED35302.1 pirin family protein [Persicimonas caeni]
MFRLRSGEDRGRTYRPWLDSRHTFSFGDYEDPTGHGFRCLRAVNDVRISPGAGIDNHSHQNMESVSYVLSGTLAHEDNRGHSATLEPGAVARMSAGSGVEHSEFNPSEDEYTRFLQIWIAPNTKNVEPEFEEKHFEPSEQRGGLQLLVSPGGEDGPLHIHQDVHIYRGRFGEGEDAYWAIPEGRYAFVHVVSGDVRVNDTPLSEGDGVALDDDEREVEIIAQSDSEILLFDLP